MIPAEKAADAGQIQLVENQGETEEAFAMLNGVQAPFDSLTARQAVAYATDQASYIAAVDQGNTQPVHAVFREGTPFYTDAPYPEYDLDKAKELVQQYQQETGKPLEFELLDDSTNAGTLQAQFLKQKWEAAGMKVTIKQQDQATLIVTAVTGNYQAVAWAQFGSPDPDYDYLWWISDNAAPKGQLGPEHRPQQGPGDRRRPQGGPGHHRPGRPPEALRHRRHQAQRGPALHLAGPRPLHHRGRQLGARHPAGPAARRSAVVPDRWPRWLRPGHPPHPDLARPASEADPNR